MMNYVATVTLAFGQCVKLDQDRLFSQSITHDSAYVHIAYFMFSGEPLLL